MVDYNGHLLACQHTRHGQLVTSGIGFIQVVIDTLSRHVQHLEETRVIEKCHVNTARVGTVVMHNLVAAVLDFGLTDKVLKHREVLDLTHANEDRSLGRRALDLHLADGIGHVVLFLPILGSVPLIGSLRGELIVLLTIVVDGVEQVLQIIEHHAIHQIATVLFLILAQSKRRQQSHQR